LLALAVVTARICVVKMFSGDTQLL